jgi:hypothetical protein
MDRGGIGAQVADPNGESFDPSGNPCVESEASR